MKTFKQQCKEYVEFTQTTAQYRDDVKHDYLTHGLSNETIEFYIERIDSPNKMKELGDVLWYIARICDTVDEDINSADVREWNKCTFSVLAGTALANVLSDPKFEDRVLAEEHLLRAVGNFVGLRKKFLRGDYIQDAQDRIEVLLVEMLEATIRIAANYNTKPGMPTVERWLDVLRMNQEKLQSRLERGVIKGEGDER